MNPKRDWTVEPSSAPLECEFIRRRSFQTQG